MIDNKTIRQVVINKALLPCTPCVETLNEMHIEKGTTTFSFTTNEEKAMPYFCVTLEPDQEGSGDPTPENPRPIYGTNSIHIAHEGDSNITVNLDDTIYGGEVEVVEGSVTAVYGEYVLTGTENWSIGGSGTTLRAIISTVPNKKTGALALCNKIKYGNADIEGQFDMVGSYLRINISGIATTKEEFNTWITNNTPINIVYELATPI